MNTLVLLSIFLVFAVGIGVNHISLLRIRKNARRSKDIHSIMQHTLQASNNYVLRLDLRNRYGKNMYGRFLPEEGMGYEESLDYIHPEDRHLYQQFIKELINGAKTAECTFRWDRSLKSHKGDWRYIHDVGIAEGHAVTFSAGLAKAGMLPYCNIYSTFLQRAYDNIVHDVALQNLHVVFCIDRAGIVGNDGATHHGLLDLTYLRPIPNMQICAPRTAEDLRQMLTLAETLDGPVAIRYPRGRTPTDQFTMHNAQCTIEYGKGIRLRDGKDIAVLTIGAIGNTMAEAIESVSPKDGLSAKRSVSETVCQSEGRSVSFAHYDMRWLKPLDEEILHEVGKRFKTIVTAEDGMIAGGLGSAVLEWMADHGYTPHVIRLGVNDQFVEHGSTKELYHMLKLDKEGLCESLLQVPVK